MTGLLQRTALLAALTLIAAPVQASPVLVFDKAIGQMYYHSQVPNQSATCDYGREAMEAAIQLWDQKKLQEVAKMQAKFDC